MEPQSLATSFPTDMASSSPPYVPAPSSPVASPSPFQHPVQLSTNQSATMSPKARLPQLCVDPSLVDSHDAASTNIIDIDEKDVQDGMHRRHPRSPQAQPTYPGKDSSLGKLNTLVALSPRSRSNSDTGPQSVIHAPQSFKNFDTPKTSPPRASRTFSSPSQSSSHTFVSANSSQSSSTHTSPHVSRATSRKSLTSGSPMADLHAATKPEQEAFSLHTDLPPLKGLGLDKGTPRAQTRQEAEEEGRPRVRQIVESSGLPDLRDSEQLEVYGSDIEDAKSEMTGQHSNETLQTIKGLEDGLSQCWTLCNTLAQLSSDHRRKIFKLSEASEIQEQAWSSCWRLCQNLYESRLEEDHQSLVMPTLEMCREFCQALFEAREKGEEATDSVLRVLWELENHLYNTQDRQIPIAIQERSLDFYLTLCHRLMKQRTSLPQETDMLLRACWSLAHMLFSLRHNNKEGKPADEDLLGSAIQACWELCDRFRKSWTENRSERGTPRASQSGFALAQVPSTGHNASSRRPPPSRSRTSSTKILQSAYTVARSGPPETPTTVFDDVNPMDSLDESNTPNILVLGPKNTPAPSTNRWSSSASSYSESSQQTASSATVNTALSAHLARIRVLLVRAAFNIGFQLRSPTSSVSSTSSTADSRPQLHQQNQALLAFIKAMPSNSFGQQSWQMALLEKYRKLVLGWPTLVRNAGGPPEAAQLLQGAQMRASAAQLAGAARWMMRSEQYAWVGDLFRVVFGCFPDDAVQMTGLIVQA